MYNVDSEARHRGALESTFPELPNDPGQSIMERQILRDPEDTKRATVSARCFAVRLALAEIQLTAQQGSQGCQQQWHVLAAGGVAHEANAPDLLLERAQPAADLHVVFVQ